MSKQRFLTHYGKEKTVRYLPATVKFLLAVMAVTRCEVAAFQTVSFVAKYHGHNTIPFFCINRCPVGGVVKTRAHHHMNNGNECGELRSSAPFRFLSTVKRRLVGRKRIFSRIILKAKGSYDSSSSTETEVARLRQENEILKNLVAELEEENKKLESRPPQRIVIETFEGEGRPMLDANGNEISSWFEAGEEYYGEAEVVLDEDGGATVATTWEAEKASDKERSRSTVAEDESCDEDEDACPIEPNLSFTDALRDRAYWLVGLLAMQSMSGFILARNEELLQSHPVIVYFLTMLVGAGGNAGNQASVRVIRGLALGTLNEETQRRFLNREFKMALSLSTVLSFAGFTRAAVFRTPFAETIAVTTSLCLIVFSSICLGAVLPLFLKKLGVDPAHSSTTIQVIMDILGVVMTVIVSTILLDSPIGQALIAKLSWGQ